ncbi:MAG: ATP-binding protein, partial [Bacteroidota bacterium]
NKRQLPGYSVVIRDLTDIRDAERSRLLETRNKELEQYSYIISHDLQEPLRTICNYIEVIEEDYADQLNATLSKYLTRIKQATMRLQRLVHELLDYSRIGKKSTPQKLPVDGLIRNVIDDLEGLIKEKQATITLAENFPELWVYELEIQQLFQNLISNALKYSKKNVKPEIGIDVKEMEEHWHFTVADNGIGVDQSSYETIFEIFRRAQHTKDYEGSGIGLAHCKKITELHDGQIGVESTVGEGSTFFFTISKFLEFNKEGQNDRG